MPFGDMKLNADVIALHADRFSESSIGRPLATLNLDHLRSTGQSTSGPEAFGLRDCSYFLSTWSCCHSVW